MATADRRDRVYRIPQPSISPTVAVQSPANKGLSEMLESYWLRREEAASSDVFGWMSSWLPGNQTDVDETRRTLFHDHAGKREGIHMASANQQIILREVPHYETVEKVVEVPEIRVKEVVEEVPQCLVQERVVEVERPCVTEIDKQVPNISYQQQFRELPCPIFKPVEKVVEVPVPVVKERLVEVPQLQRMELEKQVPKHRQETRVKEVARHTVEAVVREREVPFPTLVERIVEVPVDVCEEILREVPCATTEKVEKIVNRPTVELVERLVEVPIIELHDRIVETQEVEIREIIREVPVYETQYIDKPVRKEVYETVERIVEVPQVVYAERAVEVPEVEVREVVRHVTVPVVQYRDKMVPRHEFKYTTKDVEVPTVLREEAVVEVAQPMEVDLVRKTPFAQYEHTSVEVPKVSIQPHKVTVDVPFTIKEEVPRKVERKQNADVITEVTVPVQEYKNKEVKRVQHHGVERLQEVQAEPLYTHRVVEVPQVQQVEYIKEELDVRIREEVKEIPKISMEYRERVTQVGFCFEGQTVVNKPKTAPIVPAPIVPTSALTVDVHDDERVDAVVVGGYQNQDGIPDQLQVSTASFTDYEVPKSSLSVAEAAHRDELVQTWEVPTTAMAADLERSTAAIDIDGNHHGRTDAVVVGADRSHDDIAYCLQGAAAQPHVSTTSAQHADKVAHVDYAGRVDSGIEGRSDQLQLSNQVATAGKTCPHCGNVSLDDSKFCRKCGKLQKALREVHISEIKPASTSASMGYEARSPTLLSNPASVLSVPPRSLASAAGLHPTGGRGRPSPLATATFPPTAVHAGAGEGIQIQPASAWSGMWRELSVPQSSAASAASWRPTGGMGRPTALV